MAEESAIDEVENNFNLKYENIGNMNTLQIRELQKVFIICCVKKNPAIWKPNEPGKRKRGVQTKIWYDILGKVNVKFPKMTLNGKYNLNS